MLLFLLYSCDTKTKIFSEEKIGNAALRTAEKLRYVYFSGYINYWMSYHCRIQLMKFVLPCDFF